MAEREIRTRIALKRGTLAELSTANPKLLKGELFIVDTKDGVKTKVGDGNSFFNDLDYLNDFLQMGYYLNGKFYKDSTYTTQLTGSVSCLYVDLNEKVNNHLYYFTGSEYIRASGEAFATSESAGIMKLYDVSGDNVDGTMTQRAITEGLHNGVYDEDDETLCLTNITIDNNYVETHS